MTGTCTTDGVVEMLHKWYEGTDVTGNFLKCYFSIVGKQLFLTKWLEWKYQRIWFDRWQRFVQRVTIGDAVTMLGYLNGGGPQGTVIGQNKF